MSGCSSDRDALAAVNRIAKMIVWSEKTLLFEILRSVVAERDQEDRNAEATSIIPGNRRHCETSHRTKSAAFSIIRGSFVVGTTLDECARSTRNRRSSCVDFYVRLCSRRSPYFRPAAAISRRRRLPVRLRPPKEPNHPVRARRPRTSPLLKRNPAAREVGSADFNARIIHA